MSSRYKVYEDWVPHFITCTVVQWIDALTRPEYKNILCESLQFCCEQKGLRLHAWVIMSNHLHLIASAEGDARLGFIMRDFKKFTSKKIVDAIAQNPQESRKSWLLQAFRFAGKQNSSNEENQFWQQDYHPVCLNSKEKWEERLHYLHHNPVKAGLVWQPHEYKYSSALDYCTNEKGILPLIMLEY